MSSAKRLLPLTFDFSFLPFDLKKNPASSGTYTVGIGSYYSFLCKSQRKKNTKNSRSPVAPKNNVVRTFWAGANNVIETAIMK